MIIQTNPVIIAIIVIYFQALSWCPWQQNILATGGGAADKTVKFWNVNNGSCINSTNTQSQVSNSRFGTKRQIQHLKLDKYCRHDIDSFYFCIFFELPLLKFKLISLDKLTLDGLIVSQNHEEGNHIPCSFRCHPFSGQKNTKRQ